MTINMTMYYKLCNITHNNNDFKLSALSGHHYITHQDS